jgi:O-antigen/teichoic acid export membrane protein
MTASEGHGSQAHHGTLQKQLNLRSLVLFGLAYMTPIIVLGIFGVIAELSDGGSAGSYLLATVAMLFTALSYGLMAKHFPSRVRPTPMYARRSTRGWDSLWDGRSCSTTCFCHWSSG